MRASCALIACLVAALLPAVGRAADSAPRKQKMAVMGIQAIGTEKEKEKLNAQAELLSEIALTEASKFSKYDVIGKSDIATMIGFERQKQMLGCSNDSSCLAEIGGALGVDYVLNGTIGLLGGRYRLDIKLIETKKAKPVAHGGKSAEEDKLEDLVTNLVDQILGSREEAVAKAPPPNNTQQQQHANQTVVPPPHTQQQAFAPPPRAPPVQESSGLGKRGWGFILGGVGLVTAAGGGYVGMTALQAYKDEQNASASGDSAAFISNKQLAKNRALMSDILVGGGVVATGIGLVLVFTGGSSGSGDGDVQVGVAASATRTSVQMGVNF